MENSEKTKEETQNVKTKEPMPRAVGSAIAIIGSLLVVALIAWIGFSLFGNNLKVKYSSMDYDLSRVYINIDIDAPKNTSIIASDFAIMKDGMPIEASYISDGKNGRETFISTSGKTSAVVIFELVAEQLDKPIKILYKGKELKLNDYTRYRI